MALDFSGIPEHAERKDGVSVNVTAESRTPFAGETLSHADGRIYIDRGFFEGRVDVTDTYAAWFRRQPQVHSVSFTWTEPPLDQETEDA